MFLSAYFDHKFLFLSFTPTVQKLELCCCTRPVCSSHSSFLVLRPMTGLSESKIFTWKKKKNPEFLYHKRLFLELSLNRFKNQSCAVLPVLPVLAVLFFYVLKPMTELSKSSMLNCKKCFCQHISTINVLFLASLLLFRNQSCAVVPVLSVPAILVCLC